jgi:hypothetical protein
MCSALRNVRFVPIADIAALTRSHRPSGGATFDRHFPDPEDSVMPSDFYMRAVVTVIAISLAVIAWKLPLINVGHAQGGNCGSSESPCHVRIVNAHEFH